MPRKNSKALSLMNDGALPLNHEYYEWAARGLCNSHNPNGKIIINPDLFFTQGKATEEAAKMVCRTCGVKTECFQFALKYDQQGIWGATDEKERREYRRRNNTPVVKLPTLDLSVPASA